MNSRYRIAAVLLLAGALLACVPVLYSLHRAREQAMQEKFAMLDGLAISLEQQVQAAINLLEQLRTEMRNSGEDPCSPAGIARLQRFGVGSQIVEASLYLSGRRVKCSSSGLLMSNLLLGPSRPLTEGGTRVYTQVAVPGILDKQYVVIEGGGYALLVYPDGLVSPYARDDVALGLFGQYNQRFSARHGEVSNNWARPFPAGQRYERFVDRKAGYLVVRRLVAASGTGVVSATPLATTHARMSQFARWFVPLGVLASVVILVLTLVLTRHHFSTRTQLLRALHKGQFFLVYQPIIDLHDGTCTGAEVLLRWRLEDGTMIAPDRFIPFAEDAGLIPLVTRRVLELLVQDMRGFLRRNRQFHLGINLSAHDLESPQILEQLQQLLQDIGPGCGQLVIEVTERSLLEESSAMEMVHAIHAMGVMVAIDDFGTGYSSLASLATYPYDILKIDKSFTSTACTDEATRQVVLHIIELARTLNMKTIVECIETPGQAELFRDQGVMYAQGFLYSRPLSAAELLAFVTLHAAPPQPGR